MKLIILGSGDAFTTKRNNTCFLLEYEGQYLAVDCPHPYLRILEENGISPSNIKGMIITHLHGDHISGLDTFLFYYKYVLGRRLNIIGLNEIHEQLWPYLKFSMGQSFDLEKGWYDFYIKYGPLVNGETTLELDNFIINLRPTKHYTTATALRITTKGNGGWKLGFSGDTAFDFELIEWLNEAKVVLHEVGPAPGHSPLEKFELLSNTLMNKIHFIHYSDNYSAEMLSHKGVRDGQVIKL